MAASTNPKPAKTKTTKTRTRRAAAQAAVDWAAREAEVAELAELAGVADKVDRPNPPRTQVVRWQGLSTSELIALAKAGHLDAFDPLFRRYNGRLVSVLTRAAEGDWALAQDAASDIWVKVLTYINTWEDRPGDDAARTFLGWLCTMGRRRLGAIRASRWREVPVDTINDADELVHQADPTAERTAEQQELRDRLLAAVDALRPGRPREVTQLRLTGVPNDEIGRRLGLGRNQVKVALRNAEAVLRRRLCDPLGMATADQLREAAQALPAGLQRQVALLRLDGVPDEEIAEQTGRTVRQVRGLWLWARNAIYRYLNDPQAYRPEFTPEQLERLRVAAQTLPEAARQVALLRLNGHRPCDIARSLGCTQSGVNSSWSRARETFQRLGLLAA